MYEATFQMPSLSDLHGLQAGRAKQAKQAPGRHPRPRGRTPTGKFWDSINGACADKAVPPGGTRYPRPLGGIPKGKVWDSINGVWADTTVGPGAIRPGGFGPSSTPTTTSASPPP